MNFNDDLFSVLTAIFQKFDQQSAFHTVEPWSDDLWSQLREGGFTTIGRDATLADHAAVAKAVGRHAIALPLSDVGLARWTADHAGVTVPDDAVAICAGIDKADSIEAMRLDSGGLRLNGCAHLVPWGRHATMVLIPVRLDGGIRWVAVERERFRIREGLNFASEPRDDVLLVDVDVDSGSVGTSGALPEEVQARGALIRTAAAVGAMEFVLEASLTYAEQRYQFGRPISEFQAVQHHLVLIAEAVASVSAALDAAVHSAPEQRLMMVAVAKTMLGEQATTLTRLAHQVHGAIGATEEHPIQSRTRRLWSWQDEFGTTSDWARELADRLVFPESPGAWQVLTPPLPALDSRGIGEGVSW